MIKTLKFSLAVFLVFFQCAKAVAQNIDWNYEIFCTSTWTSYSHGSVFSIALDEFGRPYYATIQHPLLMGSHERDFVMIDNVWGKSCQAHTTNPSNAGKVFQSHFYNLYHTDDNGNYSLKKYTRSSQKWSLPLPTTWQGLPYYNAVEDYSENVYLYKQDSIFKYDLNANPLWAKKIKVNYATVDINSNLFIAGDSIFKFDSLGNQLWYYPVNVPNLALDIFGNCYFAFPGNSLVTKIDSLGGLIFTGTETLSNKFAVDTNQNIYSLSGTSVKKIDSAGTTMLWTVTMADPFMEISADAHQNCYLLRYQNFPNATPDYGCVYYARISSLLPPDTITCNIMDSVFCAGDSVDVYYNSYPQISSASSFSVELSDSAGNSYYTNGIGLGISNTSPIRVVIPNVATSNLYRIRVVTYPFDSNVVSFPTNYFTIYKKPVVSISPSPFAACIDTPPLLVNASPSGGLLTGQGIYGNYFYPDSVIPGAYWITYFYNDSNGCSNSARANYGVGNHTAVSMSISQDTLCYDYGSISTINILPTNAALYVNGNYYNTNQGIGYLHGNGSGVTGINEIKVEKTNYGCRDSLIQYIYISPLPVLSLTLNSDTVCTNYGTVLISASPIGGNISGQYIHGNYFYPDSSGPGNFFIGYAYTDSLGCSNNTNKYIHVDACLSLNSISNSPIYISPNPSTLHFIISNYTFKKSDELVISNTLGKTIYAKVFSSSEINCTVETRNYPDGVYFLRIKTSEGIYSKKIVVQH